MWAWQIFITIYPMSFPTQYLLCPHYYILSQKVCYLRMVLKEVENYGMSFSLFLFCIHFFTARRKTSKFFLQRQPHFLLLVVDLWSLRIPQLTKTHSIVNLSKSVRRTKRSRIDALSAQKSKKRPLLPCFLLSIFLL